MAVDTTVVSGAVRLVVRLAARGDVQGAVAAVGVAQAALRVLQRDLQDSSANHAIGGGGGDTKSFLRLNLCALEMK